MRRTSLAAGIVFFVFSLTVIAASWSLEYYSFIGPGPGFFPFWLSLVLGLLSVVWIVQILRSTPKSWKGTGEERLFPRGTALFRLLSIVGALCFMIIFMEPLGFQLSMFAFMIFLLIVLGQVKILTTLIIAASSSFGLFKVFTMLLDVQLPHATISFLAGIGL
ncbi:MAG: tripartite tricarboxylate transporter TctB family protein [Rectinema sp.]